MYDLDCSVKRNCLCFGSVYILVVFRDSNIKSFLLLHYELYRHCLSNLIVVLYKIYMDF